MDTSIWTTAHEGTVLDYLQATLGYRPPLMLPTPQQVARAHYLTAFPQGDIGPHVVTRVTKTLPVGINRASIPVPCMQVGSSILVRVYEGDYLGNGGHQCPVVGFHSCVLRDLATIVGTDSGERLLSSIDTNGRVGPHFVYICWGEGINARAEADWLGSAPGKLTGGQPGSKANAKVVYNPLLFGIPKVRGMSDKDETLKEGMWGAPDQKSPDVSLFHELVHADDMLRGIFDPAEVDRGNRHRVKISELRCVGLDRFDNDSIYSENSYRRERGYVTRGYYTTSKEGNAFSRQPDAALTALQGYLDTAVMSLGDFQQLTKLKSSYWQPRVKIVEVDNALRHYNMKVSHKTDPFERIMGLLDLRKVCTTYTSKQKANRDVTPLVTQIDNTIRTLLDTFAQNPDRAKFERLRNFRGELERRRYNVSDDEGTAAQMLLLKNRLNTLQQGALSGQMGTLRTADIAALDQIAQDGGAPALLRNVLAELVACANTHGVTFVDTTAGSNAGPSQGGYRVEYGAYNHDDIRLGTLAHELTHVATHMHWQNTPIMFSYPPDTDTETIKTKVTTRTQAINDLIDLANNAGFTAYQKHWVIDDKLKYAILKDTRVAVMGLMPIRTTNPSADRHVTIIEADNGISQVLWEYDTVLNQLLVYMHLWQIPTNNAFSQRLTTLAQAAYTARTT